ncbi:hypothetical protein CONPUDRAFT_106295 [Coniophora puteana RWD-64-598 SS2]|uniref:Nudix hydrolase domain-containing protein n=1 Tax=Coniophora puteana (strain RWD-64-598) TaxID=741705 RepID=A0A5M3MLW1_CONPW|nr:uncharacterized protein CONPUDRAFT_106295 [Coniophora puteana RWD-64-598 SS2]EIW79655.1 hypothetical protein CONPUDRAFT_106295 [Coniophora puteana RWD-64-598 SS2]
MTSSPPYSFLEVVGICDNYQLDLTDSPNAYDREPLVPWKLSPSLDSPVIGLLRPQMITQLQLENTRSVDAGAPPTWFFGPNKPGARSTTMVSFATHLDTPRKRTAVMAELCERWRDTGLFADVIGPAKWRAEMYPVYRNPFGAHRAYEQHAEDVDRDAANFAFEMERAAAALFGVVTYGVHMTVYEEGKDGGEVMTWIPTRAKTKQTWPGYLDNTVAGGIPSGMPIFESIVKESMEEASIEESVIRKYARSVGSTSYFHRTTKGWLQPEVEYVYDLRIPADIEDKTPFKPKPLDGEVESFDLLPLSEVVIRMKQGLFKANCAVVLIDFMIRHGYLNPDNEPRLMEILPRLHGKFDYDRW